jgi:hypothetical protein
MMHGRMLLRQAIQRGQPGAVAFVLDRGAIGRPMGLLADGLHDGLAMRRARAVSRRAPRVYCSDAACRRVP